MSEDKKTAYERFLSEFNKATVSDRMDMPFILTQALGIINLLRIDPDYDPERVDAAVDGMEALIADEVRDPQFTKELEAAYDEVKFDPRHEWCGRKVGPPRTEIKKVPNHSKQLHAIVNLMHRLGMGLKSENKGFVGHTE